MSGSREPAQYVPENIITDTLSLQETVPVVENLDRTHMYGVLSNHILGLQSGSLVVLYSYA